MWVYHLSSGLPGLYLSSGETPPLHPEIISNTETRFCKVGNGLAFKNDPYLGVPIARTFDSHQIS